MLDWRDVLVQRERYRDLMREAREEQLARRAKPRIYAPLLHHLGQRLVAWGLYLQQHYDVERQHAPTLASCQPRPGGRF